MCAQHLAKKGPTNPFQQITEREERERARAETEIAAMQKEEENVRRALQTKEEEYERHLKEQAHQELEQLRQTTLQEMMRQAEQDAAKECANLDRLYTQRKAELIDLATTRILQHFHSP